MKYKRETTPNQKRQKDQENQEILDQKVWGPKIFHCQNLILHKCLAIAITVCPALLV
jgi:hypothetical protein